MLDVESAGIPPGPCALYAASDVAFVHVVISPRWCPQRHPSGVGRAEQASSGDEADRIAVDL